MREGEPVDDVDLVIVGAGFAGLGMATRLKRRGFDSFLILERAPSVGGTWRDNTYPGVSCDIPSHLYSYSFRPNPRWSSLFAPGNEIGEYLHRTVLDEQLAGHLRLNTEVIGADWDDAECCWYVETESELIRAAAVVLACGRLTEPRLPPVAGVENFTGTWFHSARWPAGLDLQGKRVGVVGSGASAVQLLPAVAASAGEVVLLQRSAPYVVPRGNRPYGDHEIAAFEEWPGDLRALREDLFWRQEEMFTQRMSGSPNREHGRVAALDHLHAHVGDEALRAKLTPKYEYGCKRVLLSDDYYPALTSAHVRVIAGALAGVNEHGVTASNGERVDLDVLIFATGFHTTVQPYAARVRGRGGVTLERHWSGGMRAYASTVVSGFPNLFVINGPNAGLGHNSAIFMIETQIDFVLRCMDLNGLIEPTLEMEEEFIANVDLLGRETVWMTGGCDNWYVDRRVGRLTLLWPDFAFAFRQELESVDVGRLAAEHAPRRKPAPSLTGSH